MLAFGTEEKNLILSNGQELWILWLLVCLSKLSSLGMSSLSFISTFKQI
jgi:hypothetical protein